LASLVTLEVDRLSSENHFIVIHTTQAYAHIYETLNLLHEGVAFCISMNVAQICQTTKNVKILFNCEHLNASCEIG